MSGSFAQWLAKRSGEAIEFAPGVITPRRFESAANEHLATRRAGGLFDFSFMQCAELRGPRALECVEALQTRRLVSLAVGGIAYTLLLRDDGSVLNDATVWRLRRDRFWIFTGRRADHATIATFAAAFGIEVPPMAKRAVIAVQGDVSRRIIERCFDTDVSGLRYYAFSPTRFHDAECWIARLGYSGETGYEIVTGESAAPALWEALLENGAHSGLVECGFDATDSLRIEAGHILFTRELAAPVTPFELGFGRLVDCHGHDFVGARALRQLRWATPKRRLVGLLPADAAGAERFTAEIETTAASSSTPARPNSPASFPANLEDGSAAMTSACFSPLLERRIGIGFAAAASAAPGSVVELVGGGRARVARLPFYDPPKVLARRGAET